MSHECTVKWVGVTFKGGKEGEKELTGIFLPYSGQKLLTDSWKNGGRR